MIPTSSSTSSAFLALILATLVAAPIALAAGLFAARREPMSYTDPSAQPGTLPAIVAGVIRAALQFGGGYLAAHGFIGSDQTATFVGAGLFLAGLAWSVFQKLSANKALKSAIAAPAGSAG